MLGRNCQICGDDCGKILKFAEVVQIREFCDSCENFTALHMTLLIV